MSRHRDDEEAGFTAGLEALAFGVLVFVFGTLIVMNAWAVVDAKFATSAAAREAVRAVVQSERPDLTVTQLEARASAAARQAFAAHGYAVAPTLTDTTLRLSRCATVAVTVELEVAATVVPGLISPATYPVRSSYAEVVDPFRSGLEGDGVDDCGF
jgi:formate-dependent phosphoribosylglycinamide formyltransferase (GAR transformylase)